MSEMSPKERLGAFMAGKPVDRVPCVPLILNHAARVIGATIRDYQTDGEVMGRAQVAAYRRYGHDLITLFSNTAILAEAMGTKLYYPDDDVARIEEPAVKEPADADALVPSVWERLADADARFAGHLDVFVRAVRHCVEEVGDEVMVSVCYPAPFSTAAALRGTATLARDLYKHPDLARKLTEKSTTLAERFAEAIYEAGGIPALVDPVASGSVLSRKAYAEFALPGTARVLQKIKSMGVVPILHVCGRTSLIIDLMADSGAAVLSIDQIPLAEAREKVGDRVCIMGNVRPAETLLGATPDDVRREAEACLAEGLAGKGGFILASGCEVPIDAPGANVDAMMATAREKGRLR